MSELQDSLDVLRRLRRAAPDAGTRCELCGEGIGDEHRHVVDLAARRLLCTCRPCALLFEHRGAAASVRRAVPERSRRVSPPIDATWWERLQVPVGVAFFVTAASGVTTAFYPGPAGATECELPMVDWDELREAHPSLREVEPDVEAVLVRLRPRGGGPGSDELNGAREARGERAECFIVPIDLCYQLVGTLRQTWRGFDGGSEARRALDDFFASLGQRADRARSAAVSHV